MRLLMILIMVIGVLSAESRVALLIGNSDYKYIDTLQDPSTNINRLKKSLEDLDFTVTVEKNLNSEYLSEAIEQFAKHLAQDKNNIGFLYYSGHGCQLNHQGYLVPTNVDTKNRVKIKHHALSINEMLDTLSMANNRVNMLFLDACRNVPTGTRGGTKGLGQPTSRPKGSLVVYATEAGKTAEDNSNFINALIENIQQPNQNVKDIGDNISNAVADKTEEKQIPEVFSKRLPEVVLHRSTTPIIPYAQIQSLNRKIIDLRDRVENRIDYIATLDNIKSTTTEKSLNAQLVLITVKIMEHKDNTIQYMDFMFEYNTISSQYQNLIDVCKRIHCLDETKKLNQNFVKLEKSIEILNDMMKVHNAGLSSLEK